MEGSDNRRYIDMEALERRRRELAGTPVAGMTVRELAMAYDELKALDRTVSQRSAQMNHYTQKQQRMTELRECPMNAESPRDARPEKKRDPDRELAVGKYALTIMAAVLCLGAVCVFLFSVWDGMPGLARFGAVMALGGALWGFGVRRSGKSMRPFWLGVAGLGAGACYAGILAGCMAWGLYGIFSAALMTILWMGASTWCGMKARATIFTIIGYMGGLVLLKLAEWVSYEMGSYGILRGILAVAIAGVGGVCYLGSRRRVLAYLHMAYCSAACVVMSGMKGAVPCAAGVLLMASCLWLLRDMDRDNGENSGVVLNAIHAAVLAMYMGNFAAGYGPHGMILAAAAMALCAPGAAPGYIAGAAFPFLFLASAVSESVSGAPYLIPALLSCGAFLAWPRVPGFEYRLAARAGWAYSAVLAFAAGASEPYGPTAAAALLGLAMAGRHAWARRRNIWDGQELERLAAWSVSGALFLVPANAGLVWGTLPLAVLLASMQAWRMRHDAGFSSMGRAARDSWHVLYAVSYLCFSFAVIASDAGTAESVLASLVLVSATGFLAWLGAKRGLAWQCVASCASSQWSLWAVAGLFGFAGQAMLLDVLGMALAAGSVALGFAASRKPLRQCGLACALLYGLKLGLLDLTSSGSGAALGLLVAGGLCFGMSAAYNKLGRRHIAAERGGADGEPGPDPACGGAVAGAEEGAPGGKGA